MQESRCLDVKKIFFFESVEINITSVKRSGEKQYQNEKIIVLSFPLSSLNNHHAARLLTVQYLPMLIINTASMFEDDVSLLSK
jgi:hypothetical protein